MSGLRGKRGQIVNNDDLLHKQTIHCMYVCIEKQLFTMVLGWSFFASETKLSIS